MGIALIMLMAGFIKICSVHTPSSNPKLPPPKPLPGTSAHTRAAGRAHVWWRCADDLSAAPCRHAEEEATAAYTAPASATAPPSAAQRELPDGPDEALRQPPCALVLPSAYSRKTSLQRVTGSSQSSSPHAQTPLHLHSLSKAHSSTPMSHFHRTVKDSESKWQTPILLDTGGGADFVFF